MKKFRGIESIARAASHLQRYCATQACCNCKIRGCCDALDSAFGDYDMDETAIWQRLINAIGKDRTEVITPEYPKKSPGRVKNILQAADHLQAYCHGTDSCNTCIIRKECDGISREKLNSLSIQQNLRKEAGNTDQ